MKSAVEVGGRGGYPKMDEFREVGGILYCLSVPNADKVAVQKFKNFADVL